MCGRYTLTVDSLVSATESLDLPDLEVDSSVETWQARFNIAPSQRAPVLAVEFPLQSSLNQKSNEIKTQQSLSPSPHASPSVRAVPKIRLTMMRWGLIPSWAKDEKFGYKTINARIETLGEKPSFREALKRRHCVVPVSGFYEWKKVDGKKTPMLIQAEAGLANAHGVFYVAGLWEKWRVPDDLQRKIGCEVLESFTIVTTQANSFMSEIHDRMPLILGPKAAQAWLAAGFSQSVPEPFHRPIPVTALRANEVSQRVNSPANEGPDLIRPIG